MWKTEATSLWEGKGREGGERGREGRTVKRMSYSEGKKGLKMREQWWDRTK